MRRINFHGLGCCISCYQFIKHLIHEGKYPREVTAYQLSRMLKEYEKKRKLFCSGRACVAYLYHYGTLDVQTFLIAGNIKGYLPRPF